MCDLAGDHPPAIVMSCLRRDQVTTPERMLLDELRRHPCIARVDEITVGGTSYVATIARGIEPSHGLAVGDQRNLWHLNLRILLAATVSSPLTPSIAIVEVVVALLRMSARLPVLALTRLSLVARVRLPFVARLRLPFVARVRLPFVARVRLPFVAPLRITLITR